MSEPVDSLLALGLLLILFFATLLVMVWRQRQRRQLVELEALAQVGRALVEAQLDSTALYELIYQQASRIIDTTTFQLGLLEGNQYRLAVWVRDGQRQAPTQFDLPLGEGLVGWVAQNKSPLLIRDYQSEWHALPARPRYVSHKPAQSAVFIPLITGDECIGVLAAQSQVSSAFDEDDVRRLTIVANQSASAIANARLYQQAQTRAAQLELVGQISRQVRALTPLPDLMQRTVELVADTFCYYCVSIHSFDPVTGLITLQASTVSNITEQHQQIRAGEGLIGWAVTHQETVLSNDVSADVRYRALSALPDTRGELVVPLMIENEVLGVLDVQSDQVGVFGAKDQLALEALADQVAMAMQESRLYHAEKHQRSVAETLREVAQTLTSSLELETVLNAILTNLRRVLVYDAASILLIEVDDTVMVRAAQGLPNVADSQGRRFKLGDSVRLRRLAESDRPILFATHDPTGCYHALLGLPPEHACLGAPLVARGELIGFLTVHALTPQSYDLDDVAVIAAFAGQAAVAIDNARLFSAQREEAWISSSLLQVAEAMTQSTDLDEVLTSVVQTTLVVTGVDRCGVLLWDEDRGAFRGTQLASAGADLSEEFSHLCLTPEMWPPLQAMRKRPQALVLGGGEALSALPDELFDFFGLDVWLLLVPLQRKVGLVGVMLISGETADVDLIRRRVQLVGGIANQAAMAIDNAQLYSAQQEEAYVSIALLQVVEAVNNLTELSDTMDTIVRLTSMLAGAQQCAILFWHPVVERFSLGTWHGWDEEQANSLQQTLVEPTVAALLSTLQLTEEPLPIGDGQPLALPADWQPHFSTRSLLALPLASRRVLVGAMLVSFPQGSSRFNQRQRNILTGIAHQASIAIENDQLYEQAAERKRMERELEVAREIQTSFIPDTQPEEPGWSVGAYWQAARHVAGDFYDFFQLGGPGTSSRWGVVVADVSDKGVPAALYMALSRTVIRTVAHSRNGPAETLERVNDILLTDSRSDLFVTAIYCIWEPADNRITFANAGHNPPLHLTAGGDIDILTESSIVLGVLPGASQKNVAVHLDPGDALVLYTDGITDAINELEEEFGMDRLEAVVFAARHSPAAAMVQAVRDAVIDYVGAAPQFDDHTLVIIKREGFHIDGFSDQS